MRTAVLHDTVGYQLTADLAVTPYGHHLQFHSFVPIARHPERQLRFQAMLSPEHLLALRDLIDAHLAGVHASGGSAADSVSPD